MALRISMFLILILLAQQHLWAASVNAVMPAKPINFVQQEELKNWVIINDTVMGGRSSANLEIKKQNLMFTGNLSLENNGGFASIRRVYEPVNWTGERPIQIKLIGDGRTYQFRVRTNQSYDGVAYVASFSTKKHETINLSFSVDNFKPQWRGRVVSNAPALKWEDVTQIGFMLAEKNPGTFSLQVTEIYQAPPVI